MNNHPHPSAQHAIEVAARNLRNMMAKLAGVVDHNTDSMYVMVEALYEKAGRWRLGGFRPIGRGCFGIVFESLDYPNIVVKVGTQAKDGWPAYAAYARAHPEDPHLLRVFYLDRDKAGAYCAVVERLVEDVGDDEGKREASREGWSVLNHGMRRANPTSFNATCGRLHDFFSGYSQFDLHAGNLMYRPDGMLVITDPLSESSYDIATQGVNNHARHPHDPSLERNRLAERGAAPPPDVRPARPAARSTLATARERHINGGVPAIYRHFEQQLVGRKPHHYPIPVEDLRSSVRRRVRPGVRELVFANLSFALASCRDDRRAAWAQRWGHVPVDGDRLRGRHVAGGELGERGAWPPPPAAAAGHP